jgi:hypothetical protein
MNYSQTARQMLAYIVAVTAIVIFAILNIAGHLMGRSQGSKYGESAVVEVCVKDEGRWGCLEHLEKWAEGVRASREPLGPKGAMRASYIGAYHGALRRQVSVPEMLAACPIPRRDECAARMIAFGYERSATMDLVTKEATR